MAAPKIPPPCWNLFDAEPVRFEPGDVVIRFRAQRQHENPYGHIQGGLLAAMIDNCIGPAVYLIAPERRSTTIEMKVSYLAPARPGDEIIGRAEVIKHGRSAAFIEVSLERADGTLLARASATNVFLEQVEVSQTTREFFAAHGLPPDGSSPR